MRRNFLKLAFEPLEPRWLLDAGPLVISEFMAENHSVLADADGDFSDWIEIHNPTDSAVDLEGWYLTDDPADLTKWQFPAVSVEAGGFLVVFASDKDRSGPSDNGNGPAELHTNFKLTPDGEYLGLVRDDGATVSHDLSPAFPEQYGDISYGLVQDAAPLVSEGATLTYLVPTSAEAALGTSWTQPGFGDWDWNGSAGEPSVLITEVFPGSPDWLEIQNVSADPVDTTGWVVAVNDATDFFGPADINAVFPELWHLSGTLGPDALRYRTDDSTDTDNYWGGDVFWRTSGNGWVLMVDAGGHVADFVVWGYSGAEIASMSVEISGFPITVSDIWKGTAIPPETGSADSMQRVGNLDNDNAADWVIATPPSQSAKNTDLTTPFSSGGANALRTGIGFNMNSSGFNVKYYKANVPVEGISAAEEVILEAGLQSAVRSEVAPVINYENTATAGHYGNNLPFPGTTIGSDVDDFVVEATATIEIPTAGPWTFGVNSDDGFSLELWRAQQAVPGTGDTLAFSYPGTRGQCLAEPTPCDVLETFSLIEPGAYNLRLVYFERDGGAGLELFAASGSYGAFDAGAFDLVGDAVGGGLTAMRYRDVIGTDVEAEMRGAGASIWTRIRVDAEDPARLGAMQLRMMYNDGFVAYLNGREIARRNAPASPAWNSRATAARSLEQSMVYEEINVSRFLGDLQPGRNLLAIHGLNAAADDDEFLILPELVGVSTQELERYFATPTPGRANGTSFTDFVAEPQFSVEHGFFENPITLAISTPTPGATIRYTTDGTEPTESGQGVTYTGPFSIGSTTILRAAAFKAGYQRSWVNTQTYIFLDDVLRQSPTGIPPGGWPPGPVGSQVLDYGMDPEIVDDPTWGPQLEEALTSIPTMSLVTDLDNLLHPARGIYVNASQAGVDWERPASLELIYADGTEGFQIEAGLKIRGGFTDRDTNPKHAFRLFFGIEAWRAELDKYGPGSAAGGRLEYPLFGDDGRFEVIDLRSARHDSWSFDGSPAATMVRDVFSRDTQGAMGQPYTRSRYYHLYLDGQYWGIYQTQERSDAAYAETYLGGDRDDYDVITVSPEAGYTISATDGNLDAWQELWNQATEGFATDEAYYRVQGLRADGTRDPSYPVLLDVDNLIDYMLVILYTGDKEGPISALRGNQDPGNFFAIRNRNGQEGFKFFVQEAEQTLSKGATNRNGPWPAGDEFLKSNPQWIHQRLMAHPEYRLRFADRAHARLFNDGLLTPPAAAARLTARASELEMAVIAESARWGDAQVARPFEKTDWRSAIDDELNDFLPGRTQAVIDQLKVTTLPPELGGSPAALYPAVEAPTYNQHGGQVEEGFLLSMSAPSGTIYYTLDGSDPRLPGVNGDGGGISPVAEVYSGPIPITESTVVKARAKSGGSWSALSVAEFFVGDPAVAGKLAISELSYHPHDPTPDELLVDPTLRDEDFEFIELWNTTDVDLDLSGVEFTDGVQFAFGSLAVPAKAPSSAFRKLPAGGRVVVVRNLAAFQSRYGPEINVAGEYVGGLNNAGEEIILMDRFGVPVVDFSYGDSGLWPTRADGGGSTLELVDPSRNYSQAANWRPSSRLGGTPGGANVVRTGDVVVNEVLSQPLIGELDAIELYNTSAGPVDVGGWYLSDSSNNLLTKRFQIPEGPEAVIPAGGFLVFDEDDFNASGGGDPNDFALDADGEGVFLLEADNCQLPAFGCELWFADQVLFGEALGGVTFGRWPDGAEFSQRGSVQLVMLSAATLGGPNAAPRAGSVVINEMHVDPDVKTDLIEYIELYNAGETAVDLSDWYFSAGVSYVFPAGTTLAVGGYVVVAQDPAAVRNKFGIALPLGPFVGKLENDGEAVVLRDAAGIKQDEVEYGLGFPWPVVGDPPGYSMELINPGLDNNHPGSWRSSVGAPGGTPGARNRIFAVNAPPNIDHLRHWPKQPAADEDVTVTVEVSDPDGVAGVSLSYQLVDPGDYINLADSRYNQPAYWTAVAMHDDGIDADAWGGDDVYTVVLPGAIQMHRRLVRYRITVEDALGESVTAPYADDPQPNFAYYVYDGVPSWTGSARPGVQPPVTYDSSLLESVPVYQFLTTRQDRLNAMHVPYRWGASGQELPSSGSYGGSQYRWQGTLVYDGEVYDHIRYRARGGVWRYAMGKNMWKFDFNKGHYFQAYDDYGRPYHTTWDKLNFSAIIQQGNYWHRGEQGLFEAVGFRLFNLVGVEAPYTHYVHFRVVEDADEGGPDQFSTDFRGLYLVLEQPDGRLLDEHGLPDGNFYKIEGYNGALNNQGPTQPRDGSDLRQFQVFRSSTPSEQWWRANFDLNRYYSYRSIVEAIHHYDIAYGKNYFYYHNPQTDIWSIHPWDVDLTWANNMYGNGNHQLKSKVANRAEFRTEYRNRLREIRDLLYNRQETGMLIDEIASFVYTPGQPSLVEADAAMWDFNPILASSYVNSSKAGYDRFYRPPGFARKGTFADMIELMKTYVDSRGAWIDSVILDDEGQIPDTPTITYVGEAGFPADGLSFRASNYSSPAPFAAMKWRLARVTDPGSPNFDPSQPRHYEIGAEWESDEITSFDANFTIPPKALEQENVGELYRVRVRMKDSGGRWSHWSEPVQFELGAARGPLARGLRISELNYNPHPPSAAELAENPNFSAGDFEFIELHNTTDQTLDLTGVRFTDGIEFDFTGSLLTSLSADQYVVVVKDLAAFTARYGAEATAGVAGQYNGKLKNEGERVELIDPFGRIIHAFSYDNSGRWPPRADGKGSSLEVLDVTGDYSRPENWLPSIDYGGSPTQPGTEPLSLVVVNEVLTRTQTSDAIELHNTTLSPVDVGGWYLSNSSDNYQKFQIPAGTMIPPQGYVVFTEEDFNPSSSARQGSMPGSPQPNHFALDGTHGDEVWLLSADQTGKPTRFVDFLEFGAAAKEESFGRWPNGVGELYPMITPTLDPQRPEEGENSGPRVGPIIISEVHYNPEAAGEDIEALRAELDDLEFIEIYNPTDQAVDLTNWRLGKGVDYDFRPGTLLDAHSALLIVPFELTETDKLAAFAAHYGITEPVQIAGGYTGRLSDSGERVQLQRPGDEPADEPGFIPRLLEDEVIYSNQPPWPTAADGQGASLNRVAVDAWGNTHLSWIPLPPSPGVAFPPEAYVAGRHVFYNNSTFDGNDPAAGAADDAAIAPDKVALLPGQTATFANYTSYSRGLVGILVDLEGMPAGIVPENGDFEFRLGNSNDPSGWALAPAPSSISVRRGEGTGNSDRITILWPEGAIENGWLEVTVLATAATGLGEDDVFYFGNAIGETGDSTVDAKVTIFDMLGTRDNQRSFLNPAPIDFDFDFNRDARVNTYDMLIARDNQTHFLNALKLITVPESKAARAPFADAAEAGETRAHDAVLGHHTGEKTPRCWSLPVRLRWLFEYEQANTPQPSSQRTGPAEAAFDKLLAGSRWR